MNRIAGAYSNFGFAVLTFLILVPFAFYATYFSVFLAPKPVVEHLHFAVMVLWLGLSVAQPMLIRYGKFRLHRLVGRLSYVVLPLVVITAYQMLRIGARREMDSLQTQVNQGTATLTSAEILNQGSEYALLATPYIVWPAIFFSLAIYYRKNMIYHSRYMVATMLTVVGPVVDRFFFIWLGMARLGPLPAEYVSFMVIDASLLALLMLDVKAGRDSKPLSVSLGVYFAGQLSYLLLSKTAIWYTIAPVFLQF